MTGMLHKSFVCLRIAALAAVGQGRARGRRATVREPDRRAGGLDDHSAGGHRAARQAPTDGTPGVRLEYDLGPQKLYVVARRDLDFPVSG
jgi:hypothetical protein